MFDIGQGSRGSVGMSSLISSTHLLRSVITCKLALGEGGGGDLERRSTSQKARNGECRATVECTWNFLFAKKLGSELSDGTKYSQ